MKVIAAASVAAAVALMAVALSSTYLRAAPPSLVVSIVTGVLAVGLLALQPIWAVAVRLRRLGLQWHVWLGATALALVAVHVVALVVLSPDDVLFAASPDGPTRARMAVLATVALFVTVGLGVVGRRRRRSSSPGLTVLHAFFGLWTLVLGIGHAVLTDGALDGPGTAVMLVLLGLGVTGAVAARVCRSRATRAAGAPGSWS